MTVDETSGSFDVLHKKVGRFDVSGRRLLVPEMNPFASRLLVASFRAFGVRAEVMETYTGLVWGKEFTSGKECFPCQVTLGDILEHLH
ncbi:MAG TPA: CoA activase, partial [Syntrophobacteraceae bacterium]|nr:CoA activase [Syntrophobacteraceae bacterium]